MPRRPLPACLLALAASCLTVVGPAHAGTTYSESFEDVGPTINEDGPQNLIAAGWSFSVQATNDGGEAWHEGPECVGCWLDWPAYDGDHYLFIGDGIALSPGDAASAWAVLPDTALAAGDRVTFQFRGFPNFTDVFQVRFSPSGGTDTGTGAFDTGDFTELLHEEDMRVACGFPFGCPMDDEWYYVQLDVPGPGRLAFRYFIPELASAGSGSHVGIDLLEVGPGITEPPYPAPGETVTWTAADSPYFIPDNRTIPAGATVIIEAGAVVSIEDEKTLTVLGTVHAQGTQADPVFLDAPSAFARIDIASGGRLELEHAEVNWRIQAAVGDIFGSPASEFIARDCLFHGFGSIAGGTLGHARTIIIVDGCTFDGTTLQHFLCQADVRRSTFTNSGQIGLTLRGFVYIDDVTMNGGQISLGADRGPKPMYVNNVTVTGYADGGGLLLSDGVNFLLGPDNVLQGNRYPVELGANLAGLLPGSVLPASGNTENVVMDTNDFDPGGNSVWAPLAIPYVVRQLRFMGALRVLPGTTIQFEPNTGFLNETRSDLIALGTPDAPITFEGRNGAAWEGLTYGFIGSGVRLDHCVVRDAEAAVGLVQTLMKVDSCTFENNQIAVESGYGAIVRSSSFFGNGTGVESPFDADGTANPNVFAGNTVAVNGSGSDPAPGNWWGAASGPSHPSNPGGAGDMIVGPVPFLPFRTEPPPVNHPPVVRLAESPLPLYRPGSKVIFHWSADDDDGIVEHRVLFSDFGHYPDDFTLVADGLHPEVRSFEFTIPDVGFDVANSQQSIRIESIDSTGRVGWDEQTMFIVTGDIEGDITFTSDFTPIFEPGDSLDVTWDIAGFTDGYSSNGTLLLDPDSEFVPLGGWQIGAGQLPSLVEMPDVSTDTARIAIVAQGSINRQKWFFSPEFTIRPDPRIGDAAPVITLTSPGAGSFAGGSVVPLAWTASDDEALHSFTIMASYDGGEVWHDVVDDLPSTTTSYDWQLPTSTGIDDVRVRVTARDIRFQNTSDAVAISITPGVQMPGLPGDLDGDGVVGILDLLVVLSAWGTPAGDIDGDGVTDLTDLLIVLANWTA